MPPIRPFAADSPAQRVLQEYVERVAAGLGVPAADQVVIDEGTADDQGYQVGDTVEVSTLQPKRGFEVVGVMHSHTHTTAYPSPTDVERSWPGWQP